MQLFSFLNKVFVRNVLTLINGSTISQIVIYVSIILLTRLFSKEFFGIYILFSSSILLIKPIISLQYELAIVLVKKDKDAINILALTVIILFTLSILIFLLIIFFKSAILLFFDIEDLSYLIYYVPLSAFLFGLISTINYWNNRKGFFKNIATGNVTKSSTMSIVQILTGYSSLNTLGLVPGMIFGQIIHLIMLIKLSFNSINNMLSDISFNKMILLAKKYKDIPTFNTLISFLNTLSNEIPVLMITKYFGLSYAGVYGLAIKVGKAPSSIVQESVTQVFYNKATETFNKGKDLHTFIKKTFIGLFKIGFLIFVPLLILSFYLDIVFGENWKQVGVYLRLLLPWLFIMFLSSPLTPLIVILNKQRIILFYDICLLTFRFLAFYVGYYFYNDILTSILLFSGVGVLFNIFILVYFFKITKSVNKTNIPYK